MGAALDALSEIVDPVVGKQSRVQKRSEKAIEEQKLQFSRQTRAQKNKERASAFEESIKRRKTSGAAVRRLTGLSGGLGGGVGNVNSSSNSTLG